MPWAPLPSRATRRSSLGGRRRCPGCSRTSPLRSRASSRSPSCSVSAARWLPEPAWGLPELALGGGLRLRRPPPSLLEQAVGQDRRLLLAAALEDPLLRVVTELRARSLPACLIPATLALLTQSIADEGPAELREDPGSLARFLRGLPSERFDDYLSVLTVDGPLVPADDAALLDVP